jgi:CubicO group peptidase (beta-lactamase class C family)
MTRILTLCITLAMPALCRLATADPMTEKIENLFARFAQPACPGACAMVIHNQKVLFAKGFGLANLEAQLPCTTNTNFRLASVSKQFTAMAVVILVERKKLSLEETLTALFPEFPPYGKQITVRQLLNHTSGLVDYEDIIPPGTTIPVLDRDVLRLMIQQDKTYFVPGSKFRYSNTAYSLLALVVEARSGNTFSQFLKQNIFEPLRMSNTLAYEQGSSVVPNRAFGYSADGAGFQRTDQSLTSSVLGDGGIYSSVADLFYWDQALYTDKLLTPASLELIFSPGPVTDRADTHYGFGWYIGEYRGLKEIWHSGTTRGFTTRIVRHPERRFAVIILTNRNEAALAEIPHQIADLCLFAGK